MPSSPANGTIATRSLSSIDPETRLKRDGPAPPPQPRRVHPPPARAARAVDAPALGHGRDLEPVPVADRARPARAVRPRAPGHRQVAEAPDREAVRAGRPRG